MSLVATIFQTLAMAINENFAFVATELVSTKSTTQLALVGKLSSPGVTPGDRGVTETAGTAGIPLGPVKLMTNRPVAVAVTDQSPDPAWTIEAVVVPEVLIENPTVPNRMSVPEPTIVIPIDASSRLICSKTTVAPTVTADPD